MEDSDGTTKSSCRFKEGDIVVLPEERDKRIVYKILSWEKNPVKITNEITGPSCICVAQRILDGMKIKKQDDYFELRSRKTK